MESADAALARLCAPEHEVSSHYLIARDGEVFQLVEEARRAWHAGAGSWRGERDINSRSIGIELDNNGRSPFPQPLMGALETLLQEIMARHDIPPQNVIGHSDMAPGRKVDPGPRFDWRRLERLGLAAARGQGAHAGSIDAAAFRALAETVGYGGGGDDATLLEAVRLRYRPYAAGPLERADFEALPERPSGE